METLLSSPGPLGPATPKDALLEWLSVQARDARLDTLDAREQAKSLLWQYLLHIVTNQGHLHPVDDFARELQLQHASATAQHSVFGNDDEADGQNAITAENPPLLFAPEFASRSQVRSVSMHD